MMNNMLHDTEEEYYNDIIKHQKIIYDKILNISEYKYNVGYYSTMAEPMSDSGHMDFFSVNTEYIKNILREKIIKFLDVYTEYHYLSNIKLSYIKSINDSDKILLEVDDYNFVHTVTITKKVIVLHTSIYYVEEGDFFHKLYWDKLIEIYNEIERKRMKALFLDYP